MNPRLGQSWVEAGADLGLRVAAPFVLTTESGQTFSYDAAVYDFASSQGMLLMETWDETKAKAAAENGFGYSCMDAFPYEREHHRSSSRLGLVRRRSTAGMAMKSN